MLCARELKSKMSQGHGDQLGPAVQTGLYGVSVHSRGWSLGSVFSSHCLKYMQISGLATLKIVPRCELKCRIRSVFLPKCFGIGSGTTMTMTRIEPY